MMNKMGFAFIVFDIPSSHFAAYTRCTMYSFAVPVDYAPLQMSSFKISNR